MTRIIVIIVFAALLLAGVAAGEVSREGLVAEWLFDEGSGNVLKDSSGNGNDGVIYGATWVDGKFGKALYFDGQNDYVEVQDSPSLNPPNQITIEAWYQPVSFIGGGNDAILDKPYTSFKTPFYQYHIGVVGDGYRNYPNSFGFDTTIENTWTYINSGQGIWKTGQWYHIIGMYDGSAIKLYVNSQLITSKPASGQINSYGMNVRIGNYANYNYFLYGTIDEIRIYNRALSDDEVKANYQSASIPSAPKLFLIKTLSPSTVTEGESTTISIKVENTGIEAKSIKVTDTIPQGFTLISGASSQEYSLMKAGESQTFQYIVKSPATGNYVTEKATATYSDEKGNSYTSASNTVTISVSQTGIPVQTSTPTTAQQTYRPAPVTNAASESSNWGSYIPFLILILIGIVIFKFARTKLPGAINYSREKKEEVLIKFDTSKKEINSSIDHMKDSAQKGTKQAMETLALTKNIASRIAKEEIDTLQKSSSQGQQSASMHSNLIEAKTAFGYKGATIIYKVKIENNSPKPISDIKIDPYLPSVFLLKDKEKSISLIEPRSSQTVTFEIRPTGECGDCRVSGKVNYYDTSTMKRVDIELESKSLSIICPILQRKEISEDKWRELVSNLVKAEETTSDIPIEGEGLFGMLSEILKDMNLFALVPSTNKTQQIFRGIARFYGEGVKGLRYAAQLEVVGGSKKSKLILKTWAEKEDALTGFYHGLLDEIEKRVKVKDYIDDSIVQYNIHYGDRIGTKFEGDVVAVRSTIGAGARKCPNCGKEVEANEKFCPECGARL